MPHVFYILFLFTLGACIGSFLNVVVWRLPRGESLSSPPSHCPRCDHRLAWRDNIPVIGWILLRGKCRYCKAPISIRYPVVEFVTGALFVIFYVAIFHFHQGPFWVAYNRYDRVLMLRRMTDLAADWPVFGLYLLAVSLLLASSLIDAELFIIPASLSWVMAGAGVVVHAIVDRPRMPGALIVSAPAMALAAGAGAGLVVSLVLLWRKVLPLSFAAGESPLEIEKEQRDQAKARAQAAGREPDEDELPDYTPAQVRAEIRKEMLFLTPPLVLGGLSAAAERWAPSAHHAWDVAATYDWLSGLSGAVLGALVGGFVVWITRILGSYALGREAMGLGDIDLMAGVGAVVGAGAATVAFFLAPFFGMAVAFYMLLTGTRRQLPYGPYLSLATAFVMLFYFPIYDYLRPGLLGLMFVIKGMMPP